MAKKDSIDKLLYKYGEKAFNRRFDLEIELYENRMKEQNIQMDITFEEFLEYRDNSKKVIKKKRIKKLGIIVASLMFFVLLIGPNNIKTYANQIFEKVVTIFKEGTTIEYDSREDINQEFIIKKLKYVPKGFELFVEEKYPEEKPIVYDIVYTNKETDELLSYSQSLFEGYKSITLDTEDAKTYDKIIDGKKAFIVEKEGWNTIMVEDGYYLYLLDGKVSLEELEKMYLSIFE